MASVNANLFYHAANLLMLAAYIVRDVLWLRIFAIVASLIAIPYYLLQPTTLWIPIGWCGIFISINLVRSWRLYRERRPVQLTADEERVRRLALPSLRPRKLLEVLSIGSWIDVEPGEKLIAVGKAPEHIALIVRGKVRVLKDEHLLGELGPGDLVGSAVLLTGLPSIVDAFPIEPVRAVAWRIETLQRYLAANPEVRTAVQERFIQDLETKAQTLVTSPGAASLFTSKLPE